ncbi:MAG: hypothetical protein ACRCXX_06180 [Cetobacterium sp.]|uniref:hypothetical protein n=1 Tax=Cetobacterium sp. TaxID=2071632 RepID=UPI003F2EC79A
MSVFSFKNNKQIEIIKEMVKTSSDRYEINGIELSKARFMWRKFQEAFQILSPGSYSIIQEAGNTFLKIDDTVLLGEAIEFQVIYVFDQESSQYIDDFPDVSILKEKYNELQRDFTNLNRLLKSNNITGDTLKMFYVLPELNEGEVWIRTKDGWKGTNVADLDKIVQDLINKIENEIKPDLTIWIQNELAKIQNRIDELMVHDYIDIPFLNKDVVQIYIDIDTKTVRECDNTKFEPLSAVGLKFIKEDGTTVTRCYFRGVYDKPATLNIQDGVYWQTHTSVDGLTLIQPQKWKSQAFELSNGKMYFDRGNPILIQGELGTIVFKEYETLNQAKADSSLVSGDYVIVTGDAQTNDGGQGVYQLVNGIFELRDFNRSFLGQKLDKQDTIEELKKSTQYVVGDVVEVLGFHAKGDGSHHKRIAKSEDDGSGELGQGGIWWCIAHNGEVNVSWFGWRNDGTTINISKADMLNFDNCTYIFNGGEYVFDFSNITSWFKCFYFREKNTRILGNGARLKVINGGIRNTSMFAVSAGKYFELRDVKLHYDRTTATGWESFDEYGHAINIMTSSHGGEANMVWTKKIVVENVEGYDWTGDTMCLWGCEEAYVNNIKSFNARRNGFSLAGVKDFVGGYMYSEGANGLDPMAGLDIELDIPCDFTQKITIDTLETRNNTHRGLLFVDVIKNADVLINNFISYNEPAFEAISDYLVDTSKVIINNMKTIGSKNFVYKTKGIKEQIQVNKIDCKFIGNNDSPFVANSGNITYNSKMYLGDVKLNATGNISSIFNLKTYGTASDGMIARTTSLTTNYMKKIFEDDSYKDRGIDYNLIKFVGSRTSGETLDFDSYSKNELVDIAGITFTKENYNQTIKEFNCLKSAYLQANNSILPFYKDGVLTTSAFSSGRVFSLICDGSSFYYTDLSKKTSIAQQLDTPYYTYKMQQEGIYADYIAYRDELHEYENSQTTDETMLLPVLHEPVIPESVRVFAEKYKLI